jgi:hypothetical protein
MNLKRAAKFRRSFSICAPTWVEAHPPQEKVPAPRLPTVSPAAASMPNAAAAAAQRCLQQPVKPAGPSQAIAGHVACDQVYTQPECESIKNYLENHRLIKAHNKFTPENEYYPFSWI